MLSAFFGCAVAAAANDTEDNDVVVWLRRCRLPLAAAARPPILRRPLVAVDDDEVAVDVATSKCWRGIDCCVVWIVVKDGAASLVLLAASSLCSAEEEEVFLPAWRRLTLSSMLTSGSSSST